MLQLIADRWSLIELFHRIQRAHPKILGKSLILNSLTHHVFLSPSISISLCDFHSHTLFFSLSNFYLTVDDWRNEYKDASLFALSISVSQSFYRLVYMSVCPVVYICLSVCLSVCLTKSHMIGCYLRSYNKIECMQKNWKDTAWTGRLHLLILDTDRHGDPGQWSPLPRGTQDLNSKREKKGIKEEGELHIQITIWITEGCKEEKEWREVNICRMQYDGIYKLIKKSELPRIDAKRSRGSTSIKMKYAWNRLAILRFYRFTKNAIVGKQIWIVGWRIMIRYNSSKVSRLILVKSLQLYIQMSS